MQSINAWWAYVLAMDVAIRAAIIGIVGAIIAGGLGGLIGGRLSVRAALEGANKAHLDNLARDGLASTRHLIGLIQAVQAEVAAVVEAFEVEVGPAIRQMKAENGLDIVFPISRDYFVVYPANAALLGHIEDAVLRSQIVKVYIAMKSMIDTIHMNNHLRENYEQAAKNFFLQGGPAALAPPAAKVDAEVSQQVLAEYGPKMKAVFNTVIDEIEELFAASNRWLVEHGAPENPPPKVDRAA